MKRDSLGLEATEGAMDDKRNEGSSAFTGFGAEWRSPTCCKWCVLCE